MKNKIAIQLLSTFLTVGLCSASTNVFNFDEDPSGILSVSRSGDNGTLAAMAGFWFASGGSTLETGVSDQSTNGYFAITQTTPTEVSHGMRSTIIFDDFDNGLVVAGFTFSCDVRIGDGNATPADGFSINYARDTDPVLFGGAFSSGPGGNPPNAAEEGTTTGLAISFDAFANSGSDPIGLTIKVDNTVITNLAMPTLNGACSDATSLQTGTNNTDVTNLCWQPLNVTLATSGLLSVRYKNVTLLTNFQTAFTPGPGRLIMAGRTGASYQEQDVDNIRIVTIAPGTPAVGPSSGNANGFRFNIIDSGFATPDTNTITMTLDGSPVTATSIIQSGSPGGGTGVTTVGYRNTSLLLAAGSTHTNTVRFTGSTFNGAVDATNVFTIPAYTILSSAQQAPGAVNTNLSGFSGRIHQLPIPRFPSQTNLVGIERQLADGFIDTNTGLPYVSIALTNTFTNEVVNWAQDQPIGGTAGFFNISASAPADWPDDPISGVDPNVQGTDNLAGELLTILDLPIGAYQLGVNHDDGFKLSLGSEPRDVFKNAVLSSSIAVGDTSPINIVATNAGKYPLRVVWGENTGNAQLEMYMLDLSTGLRVLINNRTNAQRIVAYSDLGALTQPYVRWASPGPGEGGDPRRIIVKLEDGTAASVISGSVTLRVNGAGTSSVSKTGGSTTVICTNSTVPAGTNATATLVYSTSAGGPFTNTWSFVISYFGQVMFDVRLNEGAGTNVSESARGFQGIFITNNPSWTNDTPTRAANDYAMFFRGAGTKALLVDSNHIITLGPDTSGTEGDYTLQSWVKLPTGFDPSTRMIMFGYEGVPGFTFSINNNPVRALHTTTFGLNDIPSTNAVVPNDNLWHHVAVVHQNGTSMKFYVDGVLGQEVPYTRGPGSRTSFTIALGGSVGNLNNPMTGSLDRILATKGALPPSQFDYPISVALAIQRSGNSNLVSWPVWASNVVLQSSDAVLPSGTIWNDVSGTPSTSGSTVSLSVSNTPAAKYFRLRSGP